MVKYNLVMVLNRDESQILTLYRMKNPYKGLYNLPGGKVENGEDLFSSAYRELEEETGILSEHINLKKFMDFIWYPIDMEMHVFIGRINREISLREEIHPLEWHSINNDFFNMNRYAGEGNIGHMVEIYKSLKNQLNLSKIAEDE